MTSAFAVVFALTREAVPFERRNTGAHIMVSGIGAALARGAAARAVELWQPKLLIAAGFCGALAPHLKVGDIVTSPRILSVDHMVCDPAEKARLREEHDADAVDMESAAVEAVCAEHNIPFLAVRAVSDTSDTRLSPAVERVLASGEPSVLAAMMAILRRPSVLGEFRRLARDTKRAAEALAAALAAIVTRPT